MTDRGRTSGRARSHCRAKVRTSRPAADGICRAQNFSSLQGPAGERRAICRYTHAAAIAIAVDIGSGTPGLPRAMPAECGAEPRRCRLSSGTVDSRATSTERLPVDGTNIGTRPHIPPWQRDDSSVDSGPSPRGSAEGADRQRYGGGTLKISAAAGVGSGAGAGTHRVNKKELGKFPAVLT